MINTLNEDKESNFLIVCDHASNRIPIEYKNLGLDEEILSTHIAYDIGVKEVASHLAEHLKCPLVMSNFSRLLIDPNRGIDDPTLIMKISDGEIIKGNKDISFLVNCREMFVLEGKIFEYLGSNKTSSKVRASFIVSI